METISCSRAAIVPTEYQSMGAKSGKDSRFFDSSRRTISLWNKEKNRKVLVEYRYIHTV